MRLSYLDILEQCFHDKFRGYNKQEVDTFLHLVADDFKSMTAEIKDKEKLIEARDNEIKNLLADLESRPEETDSQIPQEVEEELAYLRKQVEEKDQTIKELQESQNQPGNDDNPFSQLTPEMLKEKAKKIINTAKNQAEEHRQDAIKELEFLAQEIDTLKEQKKTLLENIKTTAIEHLSKFKAGVPNGRSGNAD
ncbi:MAG: DivIVA domain-containing protein [Nitrospina sp.]|jgi:DivIVA domain-containing protein|nr:DivIVA domain-containing protein [Nitrospina sp.]MBT6717645.1 DivIVA domain-containing protein [Nitrospina sp.]